MRVFNSEYTSLYFDTNSLTFTDPIKTGIKIDEINQESLSAHTKNCLRMSQRPDSYIPVLKNVVPIPPRTAWEIQPNNIKQINKINISTKHIKSIHHLQKIARRLMHLVKKDVAVELSGGLDTAVVIGILNSIGFKPALIGAKSDRYEFRTERFIQEKLAKKSNNAHFISEGKSLPFAKLKDTPLHTVPNKSSLFYYLNKITADWSSQNSIKYVLNGIGFDTIFIDRIDDANDDYFFDQINLNDSWANDYVFKEYGVYYVNVASIYTVLKAIVTMRKGQEEDNQKIWARSKFKDLIPNELSEYRYKASFGAVYDEGLQQAKAEIMEICEAVYLLTKIKDLDPSVMQKLFNGVRTYDHQSEFLFLARLSYANWAYQLHRASLINFNC